MNTYRFFFEGAIYPGETVYLSFATIIASNELEAWKRAIDKSQDHYHTVIRVTFCGRI